MERKECNVAIIGRSNVGKSRLFNRLIGRRRAVIDDFAGVTRDIIIEKLTIKDKEFNLIDTGGMGLKIHGDLGRLIQKKILQIFKKAQIIIFVCDVTDGVAGLDKDITQILRKHSKKVILAVNKCDNVDREKESSEFYNLGIGTPIPVSALHSRGIGMLKEELYNYLKEVSFYKLGVESKGAVIKVAIIGRPNVGKSSFFNSLLGQKRAIVDNEPGTTRDSVDTGLTYHGQSYQLIDTAGMRHKSKISEKVIAYSIKRTQDSIKMSDVCLILIDAWEGLVKDDIRIIDKAFSSGKGSIVIANKWDLIKGITSHQYEQALIKRMKKIKYIPVVFASAKDDINTAESLDLAKTVYINLNQKFPTPFLNKIMEQAQQRHPPPCVSSNNRLRIYYSTQVKTFPPCLKLFVNNLSYIKKSYTLYLERCVREKFFLQGVPLKFIYQTSHERNNL